MVDRDRRGNRSVKRFTYADGDNIILAVIAIVFTVFALSLGDALIKQISADFPLWQIFVFRSVIAIPVLPSICSNAGSRSHLRRGSWLRRALPAFMCLAPSLGPHIHVTRGQVEHRCSSPSIRRPIGSLDRHHLRPDHLPGRLLSPVRITAELLRRIRFKDPESGKTLVFITNNFLASGRHHLRALQKPLAGGTLLQVDQAASADQAVTYGTFGERGEDADLDCRLASTSSSPSSMKRLDLDASLYTLD